MKTLLRKSRWIILLALLLVILIGCKGAKQIQGTWKAQDMTGKNVEVTITENQLTVKEGKKVIQETSYKQNAKGFRKTNSVDYSYYGLTLKDGTMYSILFLDRSDMSSAYLLIVDDFEDPTKGKFILALNKDKAPDYDEYVDNYYKD